MPAFINNDFVDSKNALLHISDLSIHRGYAIFDFFRTVNGKPLFMEDHLDRFYHSAEKMFLQIDKNREELIFIIRTLIEKSEITEAGIRMMLTGGYSPDGYNITQSNLVITCNPVRISSEEEFEKGIKIITYKYQRTLPHIKSIDYQMAVWLQSLLKEKKAADVLYYNQDSITEFPRSNVFIVTKKGILVTPEENILMGVTRKKILSLAPTIMPVEERNITPDELLNASEVFLTSTTKKIMPVTVIGDKIIGNQAPGDYTRKLYRAFLDAEQLS